jgi:hypothetical protein
MFLIYNILSLWLLYGKKHKMQLIALKIQRKSFSVVTCSIYDIIRISFIRVDQFQTELCESGIRQSYSSFA